LRRGFACSAVGLFGDTPNNLPGGAFRAGSLQSAGYAIFVSSGGRPALVSQRAEVSGISVFFKLVLGTDETDPSMAKGPAHFRLITRTMGFSEEDMPNEAWLIGDGAYDMQVAREARIHAIGRLTGDNAAQLREAGANVLIKDLTDLLPLLDGSLPKGSDPRWRHRRDPS
jgi:phosphoglycolate phosphatase-like HAD superfamily hydrolase